jgi:hypothetical protein
MEASSSTGKIASFSFLSPRHFVIPRFGTSLDDDTTHDAAVLQVFDFLTHRFGGSTSPQLEHTYELPRLAEGYFLGSMITRSDPSPSSSSQSFASCDRPFYTAPTSRLLVVSMVFHTPWSAATSYILFVHHSTLLKGLATESRLGGVVVPWDRWVPTETRIIATRGNEDSWVCYVHGTRYVWSTPASPTVMERPSYHLHMLDFNPSAPKRGEFKCTVSGQGVSIRSFMSSSMQACILARDNVVTITRRFHTGRRHYGTCISTDDISTTQLRVRHESAYQPPLLGGGDKGNL